MTIYDLTEPSDPRLIDFTTRDNDGDRFKRIGHDEYGVWCEVKLNPDYEAVFGMTSEYARKIAVRLVDAADAADFQAAERAKRKLEAQDELVKKREQKSALRKLKRESKQS